MCVVIESPYAGDVEANKAYARRCMLDSLSRGEAPLLSHLLYTQVLDDTDPEQRHRGIRAHKSWIVVCDKVVVYADRGISDGMKEGIRFAHAVFREVGLRFLDAHTEVDFFSRQSGVLDECRGQSEWGAW